MVVDEAFALAKALGCVGPADEGRLRTLCEAAVAELTGRLRAGAEGYASALALAAAWTALADLCAGEWADGVESFRAGALTIRKGTGRERAEGMRQRAELVLGPYLKEERFFFQGVRG